MLRKYAAVLLATTLITGPAFAQPTYNSAARNQQSAASNSRASTGGGSSGYNELTKNQW